MKKFYSVKEASSLLNVSTNTVYKYIKDGTLEGRRIGRGRIKIPYNSLKPFLKVDQSTPQNFEERVSDEAEKSGHHVAATNRNDLVLMRLFKGLMILGLGLIFFLISQPPLAISGGVFSQIDQILLFLLPSLLVLIGGLILVETAYPRPFEKYQYLIHFITSLVLIYLSFVSIINGAYGRFAFIGALTIVVASHLFTLKRDEESKPSFNDEFTRFALFLAIIGGVVVLIYPSLLPTEVFQNFLEANKGIFALIWFGFFAGVPFYLLTPSGKRSKIASIFFVISALVALVFATQLTAQFVWDVAYLSYITGVFALFLAWWVMSESRLEFGRLVFVVISFLWIAVTLLFGIFALRFSQEEDVETFADTASVSIEKITERINLNFEHQEALMISYTGNDVKEAVKAKDEGLSISFAREIFEKTTLSERVLIYDSEGIALGVYPRNTLSQGANFSSREYFQHTKATYRSYISPVFESLLETQVVMHTMPIFEDNQFIGMISIAMSRTDIASDLEPFVGKDFYLAAYDEKGEVVFNTDGEVSDVTATSEVRLGRNNIEKVSFKRSVSLPRWNLILEQREESLVADISRMNILLSVLLVVNSIFSISVGISAAMRRPKVSNQREVLEKPQIAGA